MVAAAGMCLSGCKSSAPKLPYPNDPLLVSKKPVEGKKHQAESLLVVNRGPVPPVPEEWNTHHVGGSESCEKGSVQEEVSPVAGRVSAGNPGQTLTSALQQELRQ
jgi:hypothetical protein